ncbi:sh3 domain-containing protein, partial [Quercus suber]
SFISNQQSLLPTSNVSFVGSAKNGDTFLSSIYIPSAPLLEPSGSSGVNYSVNYGVYKDVQERDPQRVCDAYHDRLDPLQVFVGIDRLNPDKLIPLAILKGAKGLAILTVAKAGVLLGYKLGIGLVISQRSDGSWSASSAIFSVGLGWGASGTTKFSLLLVLISFVIITMSVSVNLSLKVDNCRHLQTMAGAFMRVSLEGNGVATRMDTNLCFYGDSYLTKSDILLGMVSRPKAAKPLYAALEDLFFNLR